ncbi:pickpocket protein 11-like [Chrysoperla carnea]|uniref:pickpocket protein 11-like n=1 Tax=Chrysoperla carnea TaxID=189513 RepID=UPI001D05D1CC|nr:pickpocket protein 11-like [Chrysoperla carnea]
MVLSKASQRILVVTKDFMKSTSLHGYRFIIERRSLTQMLFWLLICIIGIVFSVYLVAMQWIRFQSSPTTMEIETLSYPTSTIPFPAMTLCTNSIYDENVNVLRSQLEEKGFNSSIVDKFFGSLSNLVTHTIGGESLFPDYIRIMQILNRNFKFEIESLMKYVLIHQWYTFPSLTFTAATVLPGQHQTFQVTPEIVESSSDVRSFTKTQRGLECRIQAINRLCQCHPYYYPKLKMFFSLKSKDFAKHQADDVSGISCECLARCNIYWYNIRSIASDKTDYKNITLKSHNGPM